MKFPIVVFLSGFFWVLLVFVLKVFLKDIAVEFILLSSIGKASKRDDLIYYFFLGCFFINNYSYKHI